MLDEAGADRALAEINEAFAVAVSLTQDGVSVSVSAVPFHGEGALPYGSGKSVRRRGYEIAQAAVEFDPKKGAIVIDADVQWRVIEVDRYDEARAWRLMVERA